MRSKKKDLLFLLILRLHYYIPMDFHGIISDLYSCNQAKKNQVFHLTIS